MDCTILFYRIVYSIAMKNNFLKYLYDVCVNLCFYLFKDWMFVLSLTLFLHNHDYNTSHVNNASLMNDVIFSDNNRVYSLNKFFKENGGRGNIL